MTLYDFNGAYVSDLKRVISVHRSTALVDTLGLERFGSKILVRDAYKDLYNLIVWNQISDPTTTGVAVNHNSYIVKGKFTV